MKKLPKIQHLLHYSNPLVVQRFVQAYPEHEAEAPRLFTEMLKYLWLCKKHEQDLAAAPNEPSLQFLPVMHEEMRKIDQMWHEFILITVDYHAFCMEYFNEFIHHIPNMQEKRPLNEDQFEKELGLFLDYVYEKLGEDTLKYWFMQHLSEAVLESS